MSSSLRATWRFYFCVDKINVASLSGMNATWRLREKVRPGKRDAMRLKLHRDLKYINVSWNIWTFYINPGRYISHRGTFLFFSHSRYFAPAPVNFARRYINLMPQFSISLALRMNFKELLISLSTFLIKSSTPAFSRSHCPLSSTMLSRNYYRV